MERVFSVEEIPDPFWAPPPPPLQPQMIAGGVGGLGGFGGGGGGAMNRRPSEWYLQKFMEDALLDGPAPPAAANPSASVLYPNPMAEASRMRGYGDGVVEVISVPAPAPAAAASAVVDPVEYNAMLQRKLEVELAAVAMWRASGPMHPASSLGNRALPNSGGSNLGSENYIGGNGILVQNKLGGGPSGGPGPYLVQNADARVKQATSSSSREPSPSDDDDMEGETDRMGNMNLTEEKVKKRKESNRESARRSRSRKAAHLKDLEEQVSQLRVQNSSLLRRLADASQKYNDAAVDNRVLKADVETLKAKVKMAEETVKRVTGTGQLPQAISGMSSLSIPISASPSDATSDASVPIQDNPITYFATATYARVNNSYMPEIDPTFRIEDMINGVLTTGVLTSSMDQTASQGVTNLGNLQRRVRGVPTSSGSAPWGSALLDPNGLANMEMQ